MLYKLINTPLKALFLLLGIITLFNILLASQLGLSVDEANYALYGNHLALSYYDHPPMVGWLQSLIIPFSRSNLAMRIWPLLFNIGTSLVLYRLTRRLFPSKSGWLAFIAVAMVQSALMLHLLSLALIPQVPFLFFSLLTLLYLYDAISCPKLGNFILLGLFLGLAALSEYTAILLVVVIVLTVLTSKPKLIFNYKIYGTAIIALALCSPVIIWNAQHHFIGFHYQSNHVIDSSGWSARNFVISQIGQLLAYSPIIYLFGFIAAYQGYRHWSLLSYRLLTISFCSVMLFFAYNSGHTVTLPHWTALAWIGMSPLIANLIVSRWGKRWIKITTLSSLGYSLILILFVHSYPIFWWPSFPLGKNPMQDLYGWNTAAMTAKKLLKAQFPEGRAHIFVPNWTLSSRIAWYGNIAVQLTPHHAVSQTSLWYGQPKTGSQGILLVPYGSDQPKSQSFKAGSFRNCTKIKTLNMVSKHQLVNQFYYYRCDGYIT